MLISKILTIIDDSGFLAIVDADKYKSFVGENWEHKQLFRHFVDQMNNNSLIIWATGLEGERTIFFTDKQSNNKSFREFSKFINVTSRELWLTNYEDLTMAAQFENENIPLNHNKYLSFQLDSGIYNATVRQLFDPTNKTEVNNINFEVVIQKAHNTDNKRVDKVFWLTE